MKPRQKQKLRQLEQALAEALVPPIPQEPVQFCTEVLGFQPTYQKDLIQKFQKTNSQQQDGAAKAEKPKPYPHSYCITH
jgi:hypothetical protein